MEKGSLDLIHSFDPLDCADTRKPRIGKAMASSLSDSSITDTAATAVANDSFGGVGRLTSQDLIARAASVRAATEMPIEMADFTTLYESTHILALYPSSTFCCNACAHHGAQTMYLCQARIIPTKRPVWCRFW